MHRARSGGAILLLLLPSCGPTPPPVASAPAGLPETAIHSHAQAPAESDELVVFLAAGTDPATYARDHGLAYKSTLKSDPDAHVFRAVDAPAAKRHRDAATADPAVRKAYVSRRSGHVKMPFTPNDAYYLNNTPPTFPGQWHLGGTGNPTPNHANCAAAWLRDVTGAGVVIAIVDDCLEHAHPDLAPNYDAADSWDFGQGDADPNPVYSSPEDRHGTSVAGVCAARGGNTTGVCGAAPFASVAGLRVDFNVGTDVMFADATTYHSSAGNTTIKVKNHSYGYNWPYITTQVERDALQTSTAAGTIHCFAAGNWRGQVAEDSNKLDLQSSPDSITVAALGSNGKYASYSCFGANVFVASPSNTFDGVGISGITTTDRMGNNGYNTPSQDPFPDPDYTSFFGGTSSASPLAAGVMALVKQVQPSLNNRYAKHLLVRHSAMVDPNDATVTGGGDGFTVGSAWKTNAAGFKFNQNYGFGRIDADALTLALPLYTGLSALTTETKSATVNTAIPDNSAVGLTRTFAIVGTTPLEEMLVNVVITHTFTGDLELTLASPLGTTCRLAKSTTADNSSGVLDWTFSSNAFWGEVPAGTWTLVVKDIGTGGTGTWNSYSATARMGRLWEIPPVVSSVNRVTATPTNAASLSWTVTFSKAVTGVDATDFKLTATGGVTGATLTNVTGAGATWTVTAGTGTGDGTLRLDVLDDDTIKDLQGNPLNGTYSSGQVYTIDKTPPAVTSVTSTTGNGAYMSGAAINVTVNFGESVTLLGGNLQVTLDTTDVVAIAPFAGTTVAGTYTVGAGDNSSDLNSLSPLTLSAGTLRDAAGNTCVLTIPAGQNLAALKAIVVDTTPPTVAMSSVSTDPTNVSPIAVTVTFSEPVANFIAGDIVATNGAVSLFAGGPTAYTFNLTPSGQGLVSAAIAAGVAQDAAGNLNTAAPGFSRTYDSIPPTVTGVTSATPDGTYGIGQGITVTLTFSEPVLTTGTPQLTLETGAADAVVGVAGGSGTYTVAAGHSSPDLDYTSASALALNGGTIRDAAGNNAVLTLPAPGAANSLGSNKAIVIADTHPPADPVDLMQRKADGATALAAGGTTDEGAVVFSATISDQDAAQPVKLQVEVRPTGTGFTTATATGVLGSNSVTQSGLANGARHWRARAVDDLGVAGNWVTFSADPAFTVALPALNSAPTLSQLGQFRSGGPFPIAVGGTTDETTIVFKAVLTDDSGPTRLEIEIKPVGTALSGTANAASAYGSSSVTVTGLTPGSWHWGARAVDAAGASSAQVAFGGNPDFVISLAGHPAPAVPTSLSQHDFVGASASPVGFVDDDRLQAFSAVLPPSGPLSTVKLQVEVKAVGTAFTGTPTTEDVVLGLADGGYHWQARSADSSGLFSAWVSFGGNAESAADFSVLAAAATPPVVGPGLQFKGDGTTALVGTTVEPRVVLASSATTTKRWKLQVELRPNATPFTNVATAEGDLVAAGSTSITFAGLANAGYHWQRRAVDETGAASAWSPQGGNPDFTVNAAGNALPSLSGAGQFRGDGVTPIAANGSTTEAVVIFKGTLASGDAGQPVRLRVELKPNATPFTGAASGSSAWTTGGAVQVAVGGLVDGTTYHWQCWAEDSSGGVSAPTLFPPSDPDFTKAANAAPGLATAPAQFHLDGVTPLPAGATTSEGGASFAAQGTDANGDALQLQVEIQPAGTAFANAPSFTGSSIAGLPNGTEVHWQCRKVDTSGAVSASWTPFSAGGVDFRIDAAYVPPPPLGGSHDDHCPLGAATGADRPILILLLAGAILAMRRPSQVPSPRS